MKSKLVLWAASCLLCAVLPAQWLERVVPLPDSFSGLANPLAFVVNTGNNTVYVGGGSGSSCLVVLDGVTHRKIARIPVPGHDHLLCYNPVLNKVYCTSTYSPYVYVIDAAANRLIDSVPIIPDPRGICYAQSVNKVYCACDGADSTTLTAIDCEADTVVRVDTLWGTRPRVCYAPAENKLYCGTYSGDEDNVAVVDCGGDTLVATVHIVDIYTIDDMAYNPTANKLYVAWGGFGSVIIIDCASDTVLSWTNVGEGTDRLAVSSRENKVYVSSTTDDRVDVLSGVTNQVVASIDSLDYPRWIVLDTTDGVLFCAEDTTGAVIDCAGDTLLGRVYIGTRTNGLCWNPDNNRVYAGAGNVFVVDAPARQVVAQVPTSWFDVRQVCWCAQDNELYACSSDTIAVVDLSRYVVSKYIPVVAGINSTYYYAPGNKVYCGGNDTVAVLDCVADSIVKSIPVAAGVYAFCYDSVDRKLYAQHYRDRLTAISCDGDSVVAELSFGDRVIDDLAYSPAMNRLYCALEDSTAIVIDCAADSVIGELPVAHDSHWLCYVPEGDMVACANYWVDSVQVASCSTGLIVGSVGVFNSPGPMVFSGRSHELYSVSTSSQRVAVIKVPGLTLVDSIALHDGVALVGYDSLADKVVCAGGSTVEFIACGSDSVVAAIQVQGSPGSMARGAERRLYVANQGASSFSIIRDTTTVGVGESHKPQATSFKPMATVVRGVLLFEARGEKREARGELLDISGRKVLDLKPGANDVHSLAPGVYFVRAVSRELLAVSCRKVVISR